MSMNKLPKEKQAKIIHMLCEGASMRSISRVVGVSINTVSKLLIDIGTVCAEYQDKAFHGLTCKRVQCDEIWSFCYSKEKNVPKNKNGQFGYGDVWTFTAIDADTKLIPTWCVGYRSLEDATIFMRDLASRLSNRVQLTTDGHKMYLEAVEDAFGKDIDFSQLVKIYGQSPEGQRRYSSPVCIGAIKERINGNPENDKISTSYVERQNLTMRMNMHRFTRLTNGFSKKVENHGHALALYFMYYNFCRVHKTLRVTPAMEAKVTDHVWEIGEIIDLLKQDSIQSGQSKTI